MEWRDDLLRVAGELKAGLRKATNAVAQRIGDQGPPDIVVYRGFATPGRAWVHGRAQEREELAAADVAHTSWQNLLGTVRRIDSRPLGHARLRVRVGGAVHDIEADDEGFFGAWVPAAAPLAGGAWHQAVAEFALRPAGVAADVPLPRAEGLVLVPPADAEYGVISDIDDTVVQSHVTNFVRAARTLLLENARTRLPFPGVAAFYQALAAGTRGGAPPAAHGEREPSVAGAPSASGRAAAAVPEAGASRVPASGTARAPNPVFYVSSSPWNMYDVLAEFLDAQGIPVGPLLLRDWDLARQALGGGGGHGEHKGRYIREVLEAYPTLPFILIGDSGQHDPEIYRGVVRDFPGRVLAVYIRNVTRGPGRAAAIGLLADEVLADGSALVLADDTLAAARHAAEHGWIRPESLAAIGEEKRADEGTSGAKVEAPGVDAPKTETVVVEEK